MVALLFALVGLALLDATNVLLIGITTAVVYDARVSRRSPVRGGLAFIGGVLAATTIFGFLTVLGIGYITDLVDFELTPTMRHWGAIAIGLVLIGVAAIPLGDRDPPEWAVAFRRKPWLLALAGLVIGLAQAPTAVPYLAGLALLAARDPLPALWPAILVAYCLLALVIPLLVLFLSTLKTRWARKSFRVLTRSINRYGPPAVRILFVIAGVALIGIGAIGFVNP